jgi:hypothetical protein
MHLVQLVTTNDSENFSHILARLLGSFDATHPVRSFLLWISKLLNLY